MVFIALVDVMTVCEKSRYYSLRSVLFVNNASNNRVN